jgi:hypothetical protein
VENEEARPTSDAHAQKRPRGRPKGSQALTEEAFTTIVGLIRAGVFDYVAAESAGVSDRTFREWIARGEGRNPTRPQTPRLKAFADAVRKARADARALAETKVYQNRPESWLRYGARSKPGRDGWSELPETSRGRKGRETGFAAPVEASDEQIIAEIRRLDRIWQEAEDAFPDEEGGAAHG